MVNFLLFVLLSGVNVAYGHGDHGGDNLQAQLKFYQILSERIQQITESAPTVTEQPPDTRRPYFVFPGATSEEERVLYLDSDFVNLMEPALDAYFAELQHECADKCKPQELQEQKQKSQLWVRGYLLGKGAFELLKHARDLAVGLVQPQKWAEAWRISRGPGARLRNSMGYEAALGFFLWIAATETLEHTVTAYLAVTLQHPEIKLVAFCTVVQLMYLRVFETYRGLRNRLWDEHQLSFTDRAKTFAAWAYFKYKLLTSIELFESIASDSGEVRRRIDYASLAAQNPELSWLTANNTPIISAADMDYALLGEDSLLWPIFLDRWKKSQSQDQSTDNCNHDGCTHEPFRLFSQLKPTSLRAWAVTPQGISLKSKPAHSALALNDIARIIDTQLPTAKRQFLALQHYQGLKVMMRLIQVTLNPLRKTGKISYEEYIEANSVLGLMQSFTREYSLRIQTLASLDNPDIYRARALYQPVLKEFLNIYAEFMNIEDLSSGTVKLQLATTKSRLEALRKNLREAQPGISDFAPRLCLHFFATGSSVP